MSIQWTRTKALRVNAILREAMATSFLTDEQSLEAITLFPSFKALVQANKEFTQLDVDRRFRFTYNNRLYVVTKPHKISQDLLPDTATNYYQAI